MSESPIKKPKLLNRFKNSCKELAVDAHFLQESLKRKALSKKHHSRLEPNSLVGVVRLNQEIFLEGMEAVVSCLWKCRPMFCDSKLIQEQTKDASTIVDGIDIHALLDSNGHSIWDHLVNAAHSNEKVLENGDDYVSFDQKHLSFRWLNKIEARQERDNNSSMYLLLGSIIENPFSYYSEYRTTKMASSDFLDEKSFSFICYLIEVCIKNNSKEGPIDFAKLQQLSKAAVGELSLASTSVAAFGMKYSLINFIKSFGIDLFEERQMMKKLSLRYSSVFRPKSGFWFQERAKSFWWIASPPLFVLQSQQNKENSDPNNSKDCHNTHIIGEENTFKIRNSDDFYQALVALDALNAHNNVEMFGISTQNISPLCLLSSVIDSTKCICVAHHTGKSMTDFDVVFEKVPCVFYFKDCNLVAAAHLISNALNDLTNKDDHCINFSNFAKREASADFEKLFVLKSSEQFSFATRLISWSLFLPHEALIVDHLVKFGAMPRISLLRSLQLRTSPAIDKLVSNGILRCINDFVEIDRLFVQKEYYRICIACHHILDVSKLLEDLSSYYLSQKNSEKGQKVISSKPN